VNSPRGTPRPFPPAEKAAKGENSKGSNPRQKEKNCKFAFAPAGTKTNALGRTEKSRAKPEAIARKSSIISKIFVFMQAFPPLPFSLFLRYI
jgi:hypothetical protein